VGLTASPTWLDRIGSRCVEETSATANGTRYPASHVVSSVATASSATVKSAARDETRIAALDAGRALAILGVILVHMALWMPDLPYGLKMFVNMGQYGVQLFFVISAVTITLTLEEEAERFDGDRSLIARRFYVKRFFRIAPLYYVAIAVYALGNFLAARFDAQITPPHTVSDVVANIVFIHAWVPGAVNSVVPGGWSIGVEMFFYLFAPLLFVAIRTRRGLRRMSVGLLVLSVIALAAGACSDDVCQISNNSFLYYWPPTQIPCFVVGFWLARYGKRLLTRDRVRLSNFGMACTLGAGGLLAAMLYAFGAGLGLAHWIAPTVAACAAATLLLLLAQLPRRYPGMNVIDAFGQNSYGLYIWSFAVIVLVRIALKSPFEAIDHAQPVVSFVAASLFACVASYIAARISAARIERPCAQWARQVLLPRPVRAKPVERCSGEASD
jgi:peptidoglycan/LPS O-acetylase OafA/YrhL